MANNLMHEKLASEAAMSIIKKRKQKQVTDLYEGYIDEVKNLNVDSFYACALKELGDLSSIITKTISKKYLLDLFRMESVADAKTTAYEFMNSLSLDAKCENILDCPEVEAFLMDTPIFKLLFVNELNSKLCEVLQSYIRKNNSREQRILYTVVNISYYGNYTSSKEAIAEINNSLKNSGFDELNKNRNFDNVIINCIKDEEAINIEYNLDLAVGGMRTLTKLMNELK